MVNNRIQTLLDLGLSREAVVDILTRLPRLLGYQSKQLQAMGAYLTGLCGISGQTSAEGAPPADLQL